ncbi:MAG: AMP-binding protein, partial [Arenicella sp.]|nr:AMP-binding protein [Arenicella sp.]
MNVVFSTLIDALDQSATTNKGICFIRDLEQDEFVSYAQLKESAIQILAELQSQGIKSGDELVLQYVSLKPMMQTFWACLLGGIIPIPLALADQAENARKVFTIWALLKKPVLAFDDENTLHKLQDYAENHGYTQEWQLIQQSLYDVNGERKEGSRQAELVDVKSEDIAFIQFSSGSTGTPKGVLLTHKNLLSNAFDIMASVDHNPDDNFLSWKPISHDFGMIGFHITPLVGQSNQYRIPTDAYIWSPSLWFRAVNKYRATLLGSPNFGYRHFLKLYKRKNNNGFDWDLSCVKAIFNGAEPISTDLCEEFCNELKQYGMSPDVMRCGYGLAEGSLISSLCLKGDGVNQVIVNRQQIELGKKIVQVDKRDSNAISVVDCGIPYPNTQIRIASASGRTVSDGTIGYVEIKGNSVTKGYYLNKEETQKAIKRSGWLNTQDLGFMLNGRLFIAGRSKEVIIVGGSNYFPHDIEQAILVEIGIDHLNHVIACSVKEKQVKYKNGVLNAENQLNADEALALFVYHKKSLDTFHETIEQLKAVVLNAIGIKAAYVIPVKKIPKTTSGKIQRFELIKQFEQGDFDQIIIETGQFDKQGLVSQETKKNADKTHDSHAQLDVSANMNDTISYHQLRPILKIVLEFACKALGVNSIPEDASFFDLGLTSMKLIVFQENLEKQLNVEISSTSALDFPTAYKLAECFYRESTKQEKVEQDHTETQQSQASNDDIAIVSIACRFPGTNGGDVETPEDFWHLLSQGLDPVREVSRECWRNSSLDKEELSTREGGFLNNIDQFDPHFFGISPIEADAMDPQQRLLLEVSYQAFENAGFDVEQLKGKNIGTYVGISGSDYVALSHEQSNGIGPYTFTGSMFNTAAGRISYVFGLEGPCMAIDTACSSSLVSIHQACRELRAKGCDAALVSAVNLMLKPDGHLGFTKMNALSETGRCRSFDDSADGYIRSEGCAALVLKRVDDAEKDGDPILAVIKGSAINHNGRSGGLTVPNGLAQQALIQKAFKDANVSAQDIDYVEAHGSGTKLGDPQELAALNQVFANRKRNLYLGSVKSNIGHCESAAGLAGVLKMVLSLENQQLPPN